MSERTIQWYEESFKWLGRFEATEQGRKEFVIAMRQAGLKPISCNNRIRVANAYCKWAKLPLHMDRVREKQRQLPTLTADQLGKLLAFRPRGFYQSRLYAVVLNAGRHGTAHRGGALPERSKVDFDNLLLTVTGKGNKERIFPFSNELRKILYRFVSKHDHKLIFATRDGRKLGRRVVPRDFKLLCRKLGFDAPPRALHVIRHTFATEYIRRGGSQFMLMKVLGHTSLEMTKKYVNFQTGDLQAAHGRLTPLSTRYGTHASHRAGG